MNNWSAARRISARVGLVAGLLLMSMAPAGAQERAYSKWFRYGEGIDTAWEITGDAAKPLQALIRRKGWEHRTSPRRVLVLYPRPSSAYDVAITKILQSAGLQPRPAPQLRDAVHLVQPGLRPSGGQLGHHGGGRPVRRG